MYLRREPRAIVDTSPTGQLRSRPFSWSAATPGTVWLRPTLSRVTRLTSHSLVPASAVRSNHVNLIYRMEGEDCKMQRIVTYILGVACRSCPSNANLLGCLYDWRMEPCCTGNGHQPMVALNELGGNCSSMCCMVRVFCIVRRLHEPHPS